MASPRLVEDIRTLGNLVRVLPPGGSFILFVDSEPLCYQLFPRILRSLNGFKTVRVLTTRRDEEVSPSARNLKFIPLPQKRTPGRVTRTSLEQIRSLARGELFLADLSSPGGFSGTALSRAVETLTRALARKGRNGFFLLPTEVFLRLDVQNPSRNVTARIWEWGSSGRAWIQVLSFPHPTFPEMFVPRLLSDSDGELQLGQTPPDADAAASTSGFVRPRILTDELFQKSGTGILIFDLAGSFRMINRSGLQIVGYEEQTLQSTSLHDIVVPGQWFNTLRSISALRQKRKISSVVPIRKANGKVAMIHAEAFALGDGLYCAYLRDMTASARSASRKEDEDILRDILFQDSRIPFAIYNEHKLLASNKAFDDFAAALDRKTRTLGQFLGKEYRDVAEQLLSPQEAPDYVPRDLEFKQRDGSIRTVRLMSGRQAGVRTVAISCFFVDMTAEATALRELRQLNDQQQRLLRDGAGAILFCAGAKITFASEGAASLLGYPDSLSLAGLDLRTIISGKKGIQEELLEGKWTSSPKTFEFDVKRKDQGTRTVCAVATRTPLGKVQVVALALTDISALREQEEKHRADIRAKTFLLELDRSFSGSDELDASLESGLGALLKELRFDAGAIYRMKGASLVPSVVRGIEESLSTIITGGKAQEGFPALVLRTGEPLVLDMAQYPPHLPHCSQFIAAGFRHAVCIPLRAGEHAFGLILLCSRKVKGASPELVSVLAEAGERMSRLFANALQLELIREKEQHLRSLLENLPDIAYRTNHLGGLTYISPKVTSLLNYRALDFTTSPDLWRQIVHPDDKAIYGRRVSSGQQENNQLALEYRVLPRGRAEYRWVRDQICYIRDGSGALIAGAGSIRDITEEKTRMETIGSAGEMRANVLESIREGVAVYDADLRCMDWNGAMEEITGLTRTSVLGLPIGKTTLRVVSLELVAMLQSALNGQTVSSDDIIMNSGEQGVRESYYWVRCFPMKDEKGSIRGVVLTFTDVTARRALEQSVRESEETLRNVIDGMGDALMISDLQGRVWEVNKEFTRITGYSRRDVLGMSFPYPWLLDEDMARFVSWIAELRERAFLRDFDMTWHSQDGRKIAISMNTSLLRNASGEPVAMLNIARDISDRKKLITELERRNRELETLNAISASITTSLHLEDVLQRAGEQIRDLMTANAVLIYLNDQRQNKLLLGCHTGLSEEEASGIRELHPSESATGSVVAGGHPLVIRSGLRDDPRITKEGREILRLLDLNSLGVIPLRSKDHVLGALDVGFREEHDFTDEEQQFLSLIGAQLGSAIENAQLYDEVHKQVRRLTTLYEVGRGLAGSLDLRTILSTVSAEVRKAIPADRFTYYVYSAAKESVLPLLEFGEGIEEARVDDRKEIPIATGGAFRDALTKNSAVYSPSGEHGALIVAPVRTGQTIAGFLVVQGMSADLADEAHLRLLESIATLTELALDKASLYVDIVNKSKEIESRNKELDDFTYVVSHDLKEPLISIEGYSKILLREFENEVGREGKEYLASLVSSSTRLKNLIDDLLTLSRLGRVTEIWQTVSLSRTVDEVLQDLQFTIRERNVTVDVGKDLPVVQYNPTQLSIVVRNLVTNAIKFNRSERPHISIACSMGENEFTVSVSDNGIGIESEYFEKIFMIFQRLHRTEEYRGTGAGLTIVRKIVENHGGVVRVQSTPGQGSTFSFTIPIRKEQ